ncbi:MAG: hypothetical protein H7838_03065 [Magnetococcus sp. DMHC-8]
MNAIPKKFMLILMDLGLSLLFLVIILVAVLDFNSRLKNEEYQTRGGGRAAGAMAGSLDPSQRQKESSTAQTDKTQAELQDLLEKNTVLAAELRKKNAEARQLLEDNMALLGQNASLLTRLKQEESQSDSHVKLPPPPDASAGSDGKTASGETPQAQALRQENATLNEQLAQMNTTLQRLQQQKAAQPDAEARKQAPGSSGDKPETRTAEESGKKPEMGFWDKMVSTFQDAPRDERTKVTEKTEVKLTEKGEKPVSVAAAPAPAKADKEETGPTAPPIKLEKGMVGPGVVEKLTTAFQESAPPAKEDSGKPAATPATGEKPVDKSAKTDKQPEKVSAAPAPEKQVAKTDKQPEKSPEKVTPAPAPEKQVAKTDKQPEKSPDKGTTPAAAKAEGEPGLWSRLLGGVQPSPPKAAAPVTESTPVAKGATESAPPVVQGGKASLDADKPANGTPRENGWEEVLSSFQGPSPGSNAARKAEKPTTSPAETTVAALTPARPSTPGESPKRETATPAIPPAAGTPTAPTKGVPAAPAKETPPPKGLPAEQAKVVLESSTGGPRPQPLSTADLAAARKALLGQIQSDLKKRQIPAEVNEQEGTIYLPGLLDFKGETPEIGPEKRQGMRELASVLAKHLPCFAQGASQVAGCGEVPPAVKLDALVIAGNSGPAPVGSSTFRHNWNQANARALQTFSELLESQPQLNEMRNVYEQSLFRLDGFLPSEGSPDKQPPGKPVRRVELRFIMGPASPASRPQQ